MIWYQDQISPILPRSCEKGTRTMYDRRHSHTERQATVQKLKISAIVETNRRNCRTDPCLVEVSITRENNRKKNGKHT